MRVVGLPGLEIHRALASVGVCDCTGGGEYTRVKSEWIEQGRPYRIAGFIEIESNRLPEPLGGATGRCPDCAELLGDYHPHHPLR